MLGDVLRGYKLAQIRHFERSYSIQRDDLCTVAGAFSEFYNQKHAREDSLRGCPRSTSDPALTVRTRYHLAFVNNKSKGPMYRARIRFRSLLNLSSSFHGEHRKHDDRNLNSRSRTRNCSLFALHYQLLIKRMCYLWGHNTIVAAIEDASAWSTRNAMWHYAENKT